MPDDPMSTWRVWCVDGDDQRLSSVDSDIEFTWRWVDHWTLAAVLPPDKEMRIIVKRGILTHFHCENIAHPGIALRASVNWDQHVWAGNTVTSSDLTLKMDEGAILLLEEYMPSRPV